MSAPELLTREHIIRKDYTPGMLLATLERLEQLEGALMAHRVEAMQPGYEASDAERKLWASVRRYGQ